MGAITIALRFFSAKKSPQPIRLNIQASPAMISFYDHTNPATQWLGNFFELPIHYNGRTFRNSEAAFQAQKFIHNPALMQQFETLTGDEAFRLARTHKTSIRSDWMQVNVREMTQILRTKASNPLIKEKLLATGPAYLIEHNPVKGRDTFWSDDNDGTGQNMLGRLWMKIRGEIGGTAEVEKPAAQKVQLTANKCLLSGCQRPKYPGFHFCSKTHGIEFMNTNLLPHQANR